ncbi:hypothetical protein [Streptomyces acidicola]|uniref:Uncharacterized protein n=1 Tax=Streptomyces acidicola TaxID=2596892 RepID=A0A5N8WL09_9ACTN|nr:hypothetical protein [Streptomyces acidicola]MPY47516.1 hypothetical protein [Streptomyces acidicola]
MESGSAKNNEIAKYGKYGTKRLILTEYDCTATTDLSPEKLLMDDETCTSPLRRPRARGPGTPSDIPLPASTRAGGAHPVPVPASEALSAT